MPRTQSERLWVAGAAVLALLLAVTGYFLLIGPQRARTAAVKDNVASTSFQATTLQSRLTSLVQQSKQIATYRAGLTRAQQALPAASDLTATPALLRSLAATAATTSTSITSLTVGDPAPFTPAVTSTPAAAPSSSSTDTTSAAPVAAAPASTTALSTIAVGATVTGSTAHLTQFLAALQTGQPRALLVTAATLSGHGGTGPDVSSLNLTMSAFVRST